MPSTPGDHLHRTLLDTRQRILPIAATGTAPAPARLSAPYDECFEAGPLPRPHWASLLETLDRLGPAGIGSRWEEGLRIIREHGITYNVYGDPQGRDRPWSLDPVPQLLSPTEWRTLEAGLIQRSRLLNLILRDIYLGTQRIVGNGFIPPELVYSNPGFLRPCRGLPVAGQVFLHLYGADLVRSGSGDWMAFADRTQSPSGAGYALENRTVVSRILTEEIREVSVRRLGPFFRALRSYLGSLAPAGRENPVIVLLTPGPLNATYFEHAYLARHLGVPLVEGADLTVRGLQVCLKTLEGLQPVDVILRRVDDSYCDPLELRPESVLGIPGLVQAARSGGVTIANALGSGLLESPAFLTFLPTLCRHLLDEDLLLPSVPTWWCGEAESLRFVLDQLDRLVVKPAFGRRRGRIWFGYQLSAADKAQLRGLISARPQDFIAQECTLPSSGPVWTAAGFERRSILLRTYVATDGTDHAVLPGGLTRVAASVDDPLVSMQRGAGSKDTWVLRSEEDEDDDPAAPIAAPASTDRRLTGLPSRAADSLFWLGRYTERLEQHLRVLRCVLGRLASDAVTEASGAEDDLGHLVTGLGMLPPPTDPGSAPGTLTRRVLDRIYRFDGPGSIPDLMGRIRHNAAAVRDRLSGDTWQILDRLVPQPSVEPGRHSIAHALGLVQDVILNLAAFSGLEMENMTRGPGWRFLDLGRRLERGFAMTSLMTAAAFVPDAPTATLEIALEIADSGMTHRQRHFRSPRWPDTIEVLVRDLANPRALAFQLSALGNHLNALQGEYRLGVDDRWSALIEGMQGRLTHTPFDDGAADGDGFDVQTLVALMETCAEGLAGLSDDLTHRYFSHTHPRIS
ncbi:MAG: circularly permuted type 2 ATP-grasp protein [Verrucomicrobiota bacterium]